MGWIFDNRKLESYEDGFKKMLEQHNDEEIEKLIKEWETVLKLENCDRNRYGCRIRMAKEYLKDKK